MIIMAVDYGTKNIGLALSDPTATLARPLMVIRHVQRDVDAIAVAQHALIHQVDLIVIGQSLDEDGTPTFSGRGAGRFARSLGEHTSLPIELWDEQNSTRRARDVRIEMNVPRKKRSGHLDDLAAAVILQSYLDNRKKS